MKPSYLALCGPKPGSQAAKRKPRNEESEFLLGDNLKSDAKMAKASSDMFQNSLSTSTTRKGHSGSDARRDNKKDDFLSHGRKSGQKRSHNPYYTTNNRDYKTKSTKTHKKEKTN